MGIDIRDGAQLECINCGLCVDACDEIMVKMGRPKGLIAYDTDHAVISRVEQKKVIYKPIRARTIYYAGALSLVSAIMLWGFLQRSPVDLHVLRDRNPTFIQLRDGSIRNAYTLKITNRGFEAETYKVTFKGISPVTLKTPGESVSSNTLTVVVQPDQVRAMRVFVNAPADALTAPSLPVTFSIRSKSVSADTRTVFLSGEANAR
jgi:cytochrome c oxidase accessory protein FixG